MDNMNNKDLKKYAKEVYKEVQLHPRIHNRFIVGPIRTAQPFKNLYRKLKKLWKKYKNADTVPCPVCNFFMPYIGLRIGKRINIKCIICGTILTLEKNIKDKHICIVNIEKEK